jgi:hypothetical protein
MSDVLTTDPQRIERRPYLAYTERRSPGIHRAYCDDSSMLTPWEIPTRSGLRVLCHEPEEQPYRRAAYSLGIPVGVQDVGWSEANRLSGRWFVPQNLATSIVSGAAQCDLGMDPYTGINFDTAQAACRAMGANWSLMSQAQWHALMVISQSYWMGQGKNNPTGNSQHGRSDQVTSEVGIRSDLLEVDGTNKGAYGRTLSGMKAGGGLHLAWSHDGTALGVFDLVGNVWEWAEAARVNNGRIEVIPASAGIHADHGASSTAWRAVRPDGTLVAIGAGGDMLHYDATTSLIFIATSRGTIGNQSAMFYQLGAGSIAPVPPVLIAMGLFPWSASVPTVGRFYVDTNGERLPVRGGHWSSGSYAGVAALNLNYARGSAGTSLGFRPAFAI